MNIYIVDDEKMALEDSKRCILQALGKLNMETENLIATQSWKQALILANNDKPDIAFLDIKMPGKDGLELGKQFQEINPKVNIIYVTAFEEYAIEAYRMHASGYVTKPLDVDDVVKEFGNLRHGMEEEDKAELRIQCFGNFEVFYEEKVMLFRRQKAKEFLALLVDRKGAPISTDEICRIIFDEDGKEESHKNTLRVLSMELRQLFENCNIPDAYIHTRNSYSIAPNMFSCDYYDYLKGKPIAMQKYKGEYMIQYSKWAHMQEVK